ncbi:3-ketoacyl-ACP reductase-like protein, partial [Leptotrombidium deliense]
SPSHVKTNLLRNAFPFGADAFDEHEEKIAKTYPLRRMGQPIDVAKAIAFLASDDASFTTGESMLIDGGALWGAISNATLDE